MPPSSILLTIPRAPNSGTDPGKRNSWLQKNPNPGLPDGPTHATQIALRTYSLALSLSLGPVLLPFVIALVSPKRRKYDKYGHAALLRVLRRELGIDGFAFVMTVAVAGGATIRQWWRNLEGHHASQTRKWPIHLTSVQKTFIANALSSSIAIVLLQAGRRRSLRSGNDPSPINAIPFTVTSPGARSDSAASPTLDLTLLFLVRAVDALVQILVFKRSERRKMDGRTTFAEPDLVRESLLREQQKGETNRRRAALTSRIDALVFWACCARSVYLLLPVPLPMAGIPLNLMYLPPLDVVIQTRELLRHILLRLPRSYVKWINTLASLDRRLLLALRAIRSGGWSYIHGSQAQSTLLTSYARDLGYPSSWGDPLLLPAYGTTANATWKTLDVQGRDGVGGLPCELVHGGVASRLGLDANCMANAGVRGVYAFVEAIAIYLPAHFIPVLLTRPKTLFKPYRLLVPFFGALRSACFLSTFISSYWFSVCLTRTMVLARLLPFISHDFWDGPYGCILAGCLVCGSSIWIENGKRRGEMALYVLPRAIRAFLPDAWVKRGSRSYFKLAERVAFVISLASLLTVAFHYPDSLRGLSRWTLAFILKGPNAGFWKRKRSSPSAPVTPSVPPTPSGLHSADGSADDGTSNLMSQHT